MAQYGAASLGVGPFGYATQCDQEPGDHHAHANGGDEEGAEFEPILNNGDQAQLASFFNNPDEANTNSNNFFNHFFGMDGKVENSPIDINAQYQLTSGTINNPVTSLPGDLGTVNMTQMEHPSHFQTAHVAGGFGGTTHASHNPQDLLAAGLLADLSARGVDHQTNGMIMAPFAQGSWGNLNTLGHGIPHDSPQSPMTSSGRQSSAGPHSAHAQHHGFPFSQQPALQHMPAFHLYQQQQARSQNPSFTSTSQPMYSYHPGFLPQTQSYSTSQAQSQARPRLPHSYGSDPSFSSHGYNGVTSIANHQADKANNLMGVPMAQQAAGGSDTAQRLNNADLHTRAPSSSHAPVPRRREHSQVSSPGGYGGLPVNSPSLASLQHTADWAKAHAQPVSSSRGRGRSEADSSKKRRRSQMEREDEAEYRPDGGSPSKRGSKVPKVEQLSDDDEDDDVSETSPLARSAKRRTANGNARESDSPTSPGAETSASRRKRGEAKSRQNLTDREKRQNHILSEQKRRNSIKECFAQLEVMVPTLNSGKAGFSKSEAIKEIICMIESTKRGNRSVIEHLGLVNDSDHEGNDDKLDAEPRGVGVFG